MLIRKNIVKYSDFIKYHFVCRTICEGSVSDRYEKTAQPET